MFCGVSFFLLFWLGCLVWVGGLDGWIVGDNDLPYDKLGTANTFIVTAEKYFELLSERKIRGYLGQEKNYFSKEA